MTSLASQPPRVSVVVPAYNNARDIEATLQSLLAQDHDDFEVVVADHSSTDDTAQRIARFASDPRVIILPPTAAGGGAAANWNRVSEHARGELIKLVCGDDLLDPQALRLQSDVLERNPGVVLVACRRALIDARGRPVLAARGLSGLKGRVKGFQAVRRAIVSGTNIFGEPCCEMMRRSALQAAGGWDARHPYLIDQATYSRVMMTGDMIAMSEVLASFRVSASQWSVRLVHEQADQAIAFHKEMAIQHPELLRPIELAWGNMKARAMAWMRRFAYVWLQRRM